MRRRRRDAQQLRKVPSVRSFARMRASTMPFPGNLSGSHGKLPLEFQVVLVTNSQIERDACEALSGGDVLGVHARRRGVWRNACS